jgi:hypothetical protein
MNKRNYSGINIQWPISELILSGKKTIETRTYKIPQKYINQEMLMIETPGKNGNFRARIVGIIKFTNCFEYKSKTDFYEDIDKHQVTPQSPWAWKKEKKWGWNVVVIKLIQKPIILNKRKGIIYTNNIQI